MVLGPVAFVLGMISLFIPNVGRHRVLALRLGLLAMALAVFGAFATFGWAMDSANLDLRNNAP